MVLDMVTHHESAMNDRLSGKSHHLVSQTPPHNTSMPRMAQYENVVEDQAENGQNQAKIVGKEVRQTSRQTRFARFAGRDKPCARKPRTTTTNYRSYNFQRSLDAHDNDVIVARASFRLSDGPGARE